jgi:hypothetical protein
VLHKNNIITKGLASQYSSQQLNAIFLNNISRYLYLRVALARHAQHRAAQTNDVPHDALVVEDDDVVLQQNKEKLSFSDASTHTS